MAVGETGDVYREAESQGPSCMHVRGSPGPGKGHPRNDMQL